MRSSVLTLRKPIPLARAIRWVPAGLFTPPRTLDDLALFITQSALREVLRHLRSDPEQELLGFLLGELYECPETGARYVVVNAAVRTGHAIAESDRILIPEEEWLGVQLEVRRRRTQLVGWYHSAPFVGPHPARADLDTHRALFTEPWQCGLVIATSGEAPTGAFFRSLMGERAGGGVLIPFYELPDEDEPLPADGRKRTLIDWVNYETRGTVERDESERRPFVPPRPSRPQGSPVSLSVPSAPEDEVDDEPAPDPLRPRPTTPPRGGGGLVMLPSAAELEELLTEPAPAERRGGGSRSFFRYFAALLVVAAVAYVYLWNSGRVQLPGFLSGIPVLDGAPASPVSFGSGDSENASGAGAARPTPAGPAPVPDSASAVLSSSDSPSVPSSAAAGSASVALGAGGAATAATPGTTPTNSATPSTASTNPAVRQFATLADSLEESIRNFQDRNDDFTVHRITCDGLAVGYRAADNAFIALASAHRAARESLDSASEARYRRLVDRMGRVNEEFGVSGCPRP